jgi:hypothetical protein
VRRGIDASSLARSGAGSVSCDTFWGLAPGPSGKRDRRNSGK